MILFQSRWMVLPVLLAVAGCAGDDEPAASVAGPDNLPELAPPEQGFQLRSRGLQIESGADAEFCEIVTIPGEPTEEYWVEGFELAMTDFSHHLLVSSINVGSAAESRLMDGDIQPCVGAHDIAGFTEIDDVTGSQLPYYEYAFPPTVGKVFTGGQKLVFDYHYLNTSPEPVPARHAVNFRTTAPENITRIGHRLAFVNLTIDTPPHEQASFTGECKFDQNVMVGTVVRHTHKWGTNFSTWFLGNERDGEHIWTSTDYELETTHRFTEPIMMPAGTGFRFQCDFDNTTDSPLIFGPKATDEMCILFGLWWKVGDADPEVPQFCIMQTVDADGISRGTKDLPTGINSG